MSAARQQADTQPCHCGGALLVTGGDVYDGAYLREVRCQQCGHDGVIIGDGRRFGKTFQGGFPR